MSDLSLQTPKWAPEFAPQAILMLAWPDEATDWACNLAPIQTLYLKLIRLAQTQASVWLLCRSQAVWQDIQRRLNESHPAPKICFELMVSFVNYNDTWIRDYGPLVSIQSEMRILNSFRFNGWGNKYRSDLDNQVSYKLWQQGEFERCYLKQLHLKHQSAKLNFISYPTILEGGGIETNGNLLITTKQCQLNANRGSRTTRELEDFFQHSLGIRKTLWISNGELSGDDTDAHIDTLARFIDADTLVYQDCSDKSDEHFASLNAMAAEVKRLKNTDGQAFKLVPLPLPQAQYNACGERLAATYANFIMLNGCIILPTYNCDEDQIAAAKLQEALPNFKILTLDARPLIQQGGSLHCASLQLPY